MKQFRSKISNWLSCRTPKQLLGLLMLVYAVVILVICIFYLLHKINLLEVIITLLILLGAILPLIKNTPR